MVKNALHIAGKTALVVSLTIASAQAGEKLTWFGEASFTGAYPQQADSRNSSQRSVKELIDAGTASTSGSRLVEQQLALETVFNSANLDDNYTRRARGELGLAFGEEAISVPLYYRSDELDGFGIKWRHRFEGTGSLTLAARYGKGEASVNDDSTIDAANRLASVSWTSGFTSSGVTGSLYVGDEVLGQSQYADNARKIYGFAVGGHWLLGTEHTPYVSLRYQNADQALNSGLTDYDKYTRISAGWNWQVNPGWRVRAEANFTYDQPRWNLLDTDRTRIQFSTRFDIK